MADEKELQRIREALEAADAGFVDALEARAKAIEALIALREREPETYFAMPSVAEVVQKALTTAEHFPKEPLERALREVLGASANMLAPTIVAIPGPQGGFAEVAARQHFGSSAQVQSHLDVGRVFEEVERKRASFGVVPFETSTDGAMTSTIDGLASSDARICAEITIGCRYDLVSSTGNAGDVENVYGTSEALAFCASTLSREFPKVTTLDVRSAAVALDLAREDHGAAAVVAGWSEHDPGELRRVRSGIEDLDGVETRFVVIGHEKPRRTGTDRTILGLAVKDEPGSLHNALSPFADRGINLTRIESRPVRGRSWRYLFIVELDGHITDRPVLTAVEDVRAAARHLRVLGSFPRPS
ncbi:MAG: ACT domain-containing protein [Sandaracinaceae bacterium]|nr:ACT domain-containing protein [Sandaracinaceae bacterium]